MGIGYVEGRWEMRREWDWIVEEKDETPNDLPLHGKALLGSFYDPVLEQNIRLRETAELHRARSLVFSQ